MINYIIQVLLFQALFLAVYDFFLQKETFFKWNRVYLLVTPFISFLIPLLKFETFQETVPQEYIVYLPEVILNPHVVIEQTVQNQTTFNYLPIIFVAGALLFLGIFLTRIYKIITLINSNRIIKKANYKLVLLAQKQSAFSFFNYIFINNSLIENKELNVIQHELVHCKQNHSVDLLVFEFLKIVMWFNPLIYVYQKRITLLHEYIADSEVVKSTNKKTYFNQLLAETFNVENISFINQFFKQSLIKNRIAMITKNKSEKVNQLKYLLIIPLLVGMLIYVSCANDTQKTNQPQEKSTSTITTTTNNQISGFGIQRGENFILETSIPPEDIAHELLYENLSNNEKNEFKEWDKLNKGQPYMSLKIYQLKSGDKKILLKYEEIDGRKNVQGYQISVNNTGINAPIFPGCEGTKEELSNCLRLSIGEYCIQNFNMITTKDLDIEPGMITILVSFTINELGAIENAEAKTPFKLIENEAIRVIKSLPKMQPGKHENKAIAIKYNLPINLLIH